MFCPAEKTNELINTFNAHDVNKDIQFPIEVEDTKQMAFLIKLLIRDDNGYIKTNWFHKSTWSGRYLNCHSKLPFSYKRNTISILTDKIIKLSDSEYHASNIEILKGTLRQNSYNQF